MTSSALPELAGTIRVIPGMAPETIVVTGFDQVGQPLIRMEMPADWLTPAWVAWMERLITANRRRGAPGPQRPTLTLLD